MNGRSRRIKRTIIASALFFVAVHIVTGVRAIMLRSGLSFCSKTAIPFTKSGLVRRLRPSILFLQTPATTTNHLWSNNSSRRRTFANSVRSSATAIAVSPKTNSQQRQRTTNRNLFTIARSSIAASSKAKSKTETKSKTKQPRANIKKIAMPKRKGSGKTKFYAVARGRTPGIYASWDECQAQVKGYPNVKFKSFATIEEAESYLANNNNNNNLPALTQSSALATAATKTLSSPSSISGTNTTRVDAAFSKTESSGNSIESRNKKQRIDADQHRPLPRTLSGREAAASILSNHSLLLWSSFHNGDSPEYVPKGSFVRYVERNMERPEVQTNPVWKKHVEDEIDEMIAELTKSQSISNTHAINWNRVPLIALPMDEREQERKLEHEEKSKGDDIDTGTGTTTKDSDETVADNDTDTDNTDIPPQPLPHKLFYHVMFDGGSRGNPHGHAGSGTHVVARSFYHDDKRDGDQTKSKKKEIIAQDKTNIRTYLGLGQLTNNQAEYQGLVTGLEHVRKALQTALSAQRSASSSSSSSGPLRSVTLFIQGDSDLIIKQMNGVYSCKSPKLRSYHQEAMELVRCIRGDCRKLGLGLDVTFEHVYRTDNKIADALANEAMDARRSWTTTATVGAPPTALKKKKKKTNNNSSIKKTKKGSKSDGDDVALEV